LSVFKIQGCFNVSLEFKNTVNSEVVLLHGLYEINNNMTNFKKCKNNMQNITLQLNLN